jgi:hypothetical protein
VWGVDVGQLGLEGVLESRHLAFDETGDHGRQRRYGTSCHLRMKPRRHEIRTRS